MSAQRASLPIAVFDSGIGGLTVLHELLVSLPAESYLYLGDTAGFPYGTKSLEWLRPRIGRSTAPRVERRASAGRVSFRDRPLAVIYERFAERDAVSLLRPIGTA